ncbi:peptidylprolyl isomerase [Rhodoplanes azumiensis]|uniref:Parvulin-like PPIase n=1 Tax=Rhodoplanes azumiensis TaxID=1897628 RepID=A0ABW5AL31_9BRAD
MTSLSAFRHVETGAARRLAFAIAAALLIGSAGAAPAQTAGRDPVVLRVDGVEIRESDLRLADEDFGRSLPSDDPERRRDYLITFLTDLTVLHKAAVEQKIGDEADLVRRMEFTRKKALMNKLLETTATNAVTEESVRRKYEEAVASVKPETEYHIRNMLFRFPDKTDKAAVAAAEEKAKAALKRLENGEDFETVTIALTESEPGRREGGDLGFRTRNEMGKEYAEVVIGRPKGAVVGPIWTEFGWHVVKLEDERLRKPADLDTIRDRLKTLIARQAQLALVDGLRKKAKVERLDKPAADASPAAAGTTGAGAAPK